METTPIEIIAEYERLLKLLSSPHIYKDITKISETKKTLSSLKTKYDLAQQIINFENEIEEAKELLDSSGKPEDKGIYEDIITRDTSLLDSIKALFSEAFLLSESFPDETFLEVRAGSGGEEASLFAEELLGMYLKYSTGKGWQTTLLDANSAVLGGIKHAVVLVKGENSYNLLRNESGVHRVQRVPATESSGRIHTSAASVVVIPKIDSKEVEISSADIEVFTYRSSGPGGQSVNTTDSAVRITHIPSGITVTCQDGKSQIKNREHALDILRSKLHAINQADDEKKLSQIRKTAIKSGDRSDKIRTYNFPQNRVTDHRISKSWHGINSIMNGEIDMLLSELSSLSLLS